MKRATDSSHSTLFMGFRTAVPMQCGSGVKPDPLRLSGREGRGRDAVSSDGFMKRHLCSISVENRCKYDGQIKSVFPEKP